MSHLFTFHLPKQVAWSNQISVSTLRYRGNAQKSNRCEDGEMPQNVGVFANLTTKFKAWNTCKKLDAEITSIIPALVQRDMGGENGRKNHKPSGQLVLSAQCSGRKKRNPASKNKVKGEN